MSSLNKEITVNHKSWKHFVFQNAKYKCEYCGYKKYLSGAHIISRRYKSLKLRIDNGLCFCQRCHEGYDHKKDVKGKDGKFRKGNEIVISIIGNKKFNELQKEADDIKKGLNL